MVRKILYELVSYTRLYCVDINNLQCYFVDFNIAKVTDV